MHLFAGCGPTAPRKGEHMRFALLLGRMLFSLIFILSSFGHFSAETIGYAADKGLPAANILVPLSGIVLLLGGLSVLTGYRAKVGAGLLALFLLPTTFMFHNFWVITDDPMSAQIQRIMFLKNISMLGGALILLYFGAGPLSLDRKLQHRPIERA